MQVAPHDFDSYGERLAEIRTQFGTIERFVDPEGSQKRIDELEVEMNADGFWNDPESAGKTSAEHTRLRRKLDNLSQLRGEVEDIETLLEMAQLADEHESGDLVTEIESSLDPLAAKLAQLQEEALFSGEFDTGPAIVSIQAGEGGVDAQDWAEMLVRLSLIHI